MRAGHFTKGFWALVLDVKIALELVMKKDAPVVKDIYVSMKEKVVTCIKPFEVQFLAKVSIQS